MEYRADFFTRIIASILSLLMNVGAFSIAFHYTKTIGGWSFSQAMVLLSIYYLMDGIIEMFIAPNMRATMELVRQGTLDFVLIKPVSAQFMASFRTVNIWRIINVIVGIGLSVTTIVQRGLSIGVYEAGMFAVTLFCGATIVYSFWLFLVTLTFWFVKIDNIEQIVWQAFEAGRYPVDVYPVWLKNFLTYVVPVVFIITIPAQALAGKLHIEFLAVCILVASCTLLAASAFWSFGLKRYTGASA